MEKKYLKKKSIHQSISICMCIMYIWISLAGTQKFLQYVFSLKNCINNKHITRSYSTDKQQFGLLFEMTVCSTLLLQVIFTDYLSSSSVLFVFIIIKYRQIIILCALINLFILHICETMSLECKTKIIIIW